VISWTLQWSPKKQEAKGLNVTNDRSILTNVFPFTTVVVDESTV